MDTYLSDYLEELTDYDQEQTDIIEDYQNLTTNGDS